MSQKKLASLQKKIAYYDDLYYNKDISEIDDLTYDELRKEYRELQEKLTGLEDDKVGASPTGDLPKVKHKKKLLSLDKVYDPAMVDAFLDDTAVTAGFMGELKIDGLAVQLTYVKGVYKRAVTRGDGYEGEDVTENVKAIPGVPMTLAEGCPDDVVVGAEIYLSRDEFHRINARHAEEGIPPFATLRNAAAGILRRKYDPHNDRARLGVFTYSYVYASSDYPTTQMDALTCLKGLGFVTNPFSKLLMTPAAIKAYFTHMDRMRKDLNYDIDGIVLKANAFSDHQLHGETGSYPKWAIAWKFAAAIYATQLTDILLQIGRTGVATPVGVLKPVVIDGVTVTRATLHNEDYIKSNDIRVMDIVGVQRAGDVIPRITGPLLDEMVNVERGPEFVFPKSCPSCGAPLVKLPDEAAWKCLNVYACPAQRLERLVTIVGRDALNIVGLSRKTLVQLLAKNLIATAPSLFRLKEHYDTLLTLDGFSKPSVDKLLAAIETARVVTLDKFIYALQIPNVGRTVSRQIAEIVQSKEGLSKFLLNFRQEDEYYPRIKEVPGIGPTILQSIEVFMEMDDNAQTVLDLADCLSITDMPVTSTGGHLAGASICFTGIFELDTRKGWENKARSVGARVVGKVTPTTTFLIVGAGGKAGSKLKDAQRLGVEVHDERALISILDPEKYLTDEARMLLNLKIKGAKTPVN